MCGIVGLYHFDSERHVDPGVVDGMRSLIDHRGPDDHGLFVHQNVGLGFNRLSIIDLEGGHQPMCNHDQSVWIVFNGEIYNFVELRDDLIARGHEFRSRSDTETILHSWEEHGEDCVNVLRGMFSFAIWDDRRKLLFCARDRLGIKPFYYYSDANLFCFASEMKAFLALPEIPKEVNMAGLGQFLQHRYVIGPDTMLQGVKKLQPGHTISVGTPRFKVRRYWEVPHEQPRQVDELQALEELDTLLKDTIKRHLLSDVPLGAFLSGGLDSSSVVALMSKVAEKKVETFSIGYRSPESELNYARLLADYIGTEHHEMILTPSRFRDLLPQIVWNMDEPVGDEAAVPLHYLASFARQRVKVVLSGEGSDEVFGGYPIYKRMMSFDALNRIPFVGYAGAVLRNMLPEGKLGAYCGMMGKPLEARYGGVSRVFSREQIARLSPYALLNGSDRVQELYDRCRNLDPLARMTYLDLSSWLVDDLLVKADRMTMASALELRVPFLDHKIVEFGARLPLHLRISGSSGKHILKKYMESKIPRTIIHRPKQGFPVPTKSWFRQELTGFARDSLLSSTGPICRFFSRPEIERLLDSHRRRDSSLQIYSLLVFDQWYRLFVAAQTAPTPKKSSLTAPGAVQTAPTV